MRERQNFFQAMLAVINTCDLIPKTKFQNFFYKLIVVLEDVRYQKLLNVTMKFLPDFKLNREARNQKKYLS